MSCDPKPVFIRKEINGPIIAALLTIIGYSINNTIVIFDRIRENSSSAVNRKGLGCLVNRASSDPGDHQHQHHHLACIVGSVSFGGRRSGDFTLALLVGLVAGTYSSIFIAGPLDRLASAAR